MGKGATIIDRNLVQCQVQWGILYVELCIAGTDLRWLDAEHLPIEGDAVLHVPDVERKMCLQCLYRKNRSGLLRCDFHFRLHCLYLHKRICTNISDALIYVKAYMI